MKLMPELYLRPPLTTPLLYPRSPHCLNPLQKLSEHPLVVSKILNGTAFMFFTLKSKAAALLELGTRQPHFQRLFSTIRE